MSFVSLMNADVELPYKSKIYRLAPLTFQDYARYILWYQYKEYEEVKETSKDLPEEIRNPLLKEIYQKCRDKRWVIKNEQGEITKEEFLAWDCPEIQESSNTVEGISRQLYLSLKHNHPEVTPDLADEIVTPKTFMEIIFKLAEAAGLNTKEILTAGDIKPGEQLPNQ